MNPIRKLRIWWTARKAVKNCQLQIYISRKTTLPIEKCTVENLRTGARFDERKASMYRKRKGKGNHEASAVWYEMAADALTDLANVLDISDKEIVEELPLRKRRKHLDLLLRLASGKAQ